MNYTRSNPKSYSGMEWRWWRWWCWWWRWWWSQRSPARWRWRFPPPGRNFPVRFLPIGELFSLCGFPPRSRGGIFLWSLSPCLRFSGGWNTRRGTRRGGPGWPHHAQARPRAGTRLGVVWAPCGPPSGSPSGSLLHMMIYELLYIF